MNQARSGPMLYPIEKAKRSGTSGMWLLAAVLVGAFVTHALAFTIGHVVGFEQGALQPPKVVTRTVTPLMQYTCSATERREYIEACKRRAHSGLTFPTTP